MLRAVTAGVICLLAGVTEAQRLGRRARVLRAWSSAFESMRAMNAGLRLPPMQIWQKATAEYGAEGQDGSLSSGEQELIGQCYAAMLDGTIEQQEAQLRYAAERFRALTQQAENKQQKDAKLYGTLGLLGGLCIFLMSV